MEDGKNLFILGLKEQYGRESASWKGHQEPDLKGECFRFLEQG